MSPMVPGDVICFPVEGQKAWLLMNVHARTSIAVDAHGLKALENWPTAAVDSGEDEEGKFTVWETASFSNIDGLLADPTRVQRSMDDCVRHECTATEFRQKLAEAQILVEDTAAYRERFGPKKNLLDRVHFGNFHQQLGQELIIKRKTDPSSWWLRQKFNKSCTELNDNLYGAVEGPFLAAFFKRTFKPGMRVLDLGCGPGYFSNLIADTGADVLGLDPNADYIAVAKSNARGSARFKVAEVGKAGALDGYGAGEFDAVFISDALLFYFVPPDPSMSADIEILFSDVRRLLKPDGTFYSVEPHYLFWLKPWLGDVENPYTVFTEYRNRRFNVTPTISELIQAYAKGGFAVTWMEEMYPEPRFVETAPRAFHFANEFPIGQLFVLKRTPS